VAERKKKRRLSLSLPHLGKNKALPTPAADQQDEDIVRRQRGAVGGQAQGDGAVGSSSWGEGVSRARANAASAGGGRGGAARGTLSHTPTHSPGDEAAAMLAKALALSSRACGRGRRGAQGGRHEKRRKKTAGGGAARARWRRRFGGGCCERRLSPDFAAQSVFLFPRTPNQKAGARAPPKRRRARQARPSPLTRCVPAAGREGAGAAGGQGCVHALRDLAAPTRPSPRAAIPLLHPATPTHASARVADAPAQAGWPVRSASRARRREGCVPGCAGRHTRELSVFCSHLSRGSASSLTHSPPSLPPRRHKQGCPVWTRLLEGVPARQ
jgi:hypothetical protein